MYRYPERMHMDCTITTISTGQIPTMDEVDALSDTVDEHPKTVRVAWK